MLIPMRPEDPECSGFNAKRWGRILSIASADGPRSPRCLLDGAVISRATALVNECGKGRASKGIAELQGKGCRVTYIRPDGRDFQDYETDHRVARTASSAR